MKKRILSIALALAFCLCLALPASAASVAAISSANALYDLGLFKGVGANADGTPNFDLDRAPTRQEAVTLLVRLLGREAEALSGNWPTPFTDVADWAKPYVGYAYARDLTNGTGATTFGGADTVSTAQYLTFLLRALGYVSGEDFSWDSSWTLTDALSITSGEYGAWSAFTRGDAVLTSYRALNVRLKNGSKTLLEQIKDASGASIFVASRSNAQYKYDVYSNCVVITEYLGDAMAVSIPAKIDGLPVTGIGDDAFYMCETIERVVIPSSVTSIGENAFLRCESLRGVIIPASVTSIRSSAFGWTPWFENQTDEFVIVGKGVLLDYNGAGGEVVIPSSVRSIAGSAFFGCGTLQGVTIPDSVTDIGDFAFCWCVALQGVTIPSSVTSLGSGVFAYCSELRAVALPTSVTHIRYGTFGECELLKTVYYAGSQAQWNAITIEDYDGQFKSTNIYFGVW